MAVVVVVNGEVVVVVAIGVVLVLLVVADVVVVEVVVGVVVEVVVVGVVVADCFLVVTFVIKRTASQKTMENTVFPELVFPRNGAPQK